MATPYGKALVWEDVLSLPSLDPHPGNVAYLDTETTGLSGGAGTYVFAAAVARPIDCGLRLAQLFLPHPGAEPAFLSALSGELEPASHLASFNGGSFDLPILRTRWVMSRMDGDLAHPPHVDLLTLVRALYRHRMESCNLRTVEERLLGYERDDPISGAFAPDAYFGYLHAGFDPMLESVLEHNRLDVISLVHLHSLLMRRLQGADTAMDAEDWLALGRHRFRRGARADGWRALRNATAFYQGDAAATAGLFISRRLVRRGAIGAADRLLERLEERCGDDVRVAIARARLLEWRRRDPHLALAVVEAARQRFPEAADDLEPRRARLQVKAKARPKTGGERFGDPGGSDSGEATSSAASASNRLPERAAHTFGVPVLKAREEVGRMGAEAPSTAFPGGPLRRGGRRDRRLGDGREGHRGERWFQTSIPEGAGEGVDERGVEL